jgi:L-alanine-DL-glutamate epimerase-like enolase superfamily enzyme
MKIDRIELFHVAIPLPRPFYPAWIPGYPQTQNRFTLLRLTTTDGVEGLAAGVAFEKEREGLGGLIGPYLIGLDPTDMTAVRQRLREVSYLGWRNYWIEAALWDIRGKIEDKPLWQLLGGSNPEPIQLYASTGEVHRPAERAEEVLRLRDEGFRAVKLRVHSFAIEDDIAQLATVRRAVGDDFTIGIDANQGWRVALVADAPLWDLARAQQFATAAADYQLAWLEEPLDMYAYEDLARLRQSSRVPIAGGELNAGWHEFRIMLEKGSYQIYQPDATMGGGIGDACQVMQACQAQQLSFSPHTWTNGIGFLTNLHVYAAGDRKFPLEFPYEPNSWTPTVRDGLLAETIDAGPDGRIPLPTRPGLGLLLDHDKLAYYGEKFFDMSSRGLALKTVREKGLFRTIKLLLQKRRSTAAAPR